MKLYRGLNLNEDEIDFIKVNGDCDSQKGSWLLKPLIEQHNSPVKNVLSQLITEKEDVERYHRDSEDVHNMGKYVTGCFLGASIYSHDSSMKKKNVVLVIEAEQDQVFIDSRDFLNTFFTFKAKNNPISKIIIEKVKTVYGSKIVEYLSVFNGIKALDLNLLNRYVDYICMDKEIIDAHYKNTEMLILGRYSTKFLSAFGIIGGIKPAMILNIIDADQISRNDKSENLLHKYGLTDTLDIYKI